MTGVILAQAHGVTTKPFHPLLASSRRSRQGANWRNGDEEGASLGTESVRCDFCRSFFTILDNILIIGESAGGEERAAQTPLNRRP